MTNPIFRHDLYNPYEYREIEHPLSDFGAFLNVIKATIGTGVLASPMAFRNAGWVNGIIATILVGTMVIYAKLILLSGINEMERRRHVAIFSYSEAMMAAAAEGPRCFRMLDSLLGSLVNVLLVLYHFGICCVYVVFIANCSKNMGDQYYDAVDSRFYMLALIIPLILISLVPNLKSLVPFVTIANFFLIIGFGILFYYFCSDLKDFSEIRPFAEPHRWPLFFGATLFALDAPGVIVSLEANMKHPGDFVGCTGILCLAMVLIVIFQLFFAFLGYLHDGDDVRSTALQSLPLADVVAQVARVIFALCIFLSYPLQGYVPVDIMWTNWLKQKVPEDKTWSIEVVFRVTMATYTVLIALICPNLTVILSFVGAFSASFLGLIMPALLDICVKYTTGYGQCKIDLILSILVLIVGFVGGIAGSYMPLQQLVQLYQESPDIAERLL